MSSQFLQENAVGNHVKGFTKVQPLLLRSLLLAPKGLHGCLATASGQARHQFSGGVNCVQLSLSVDSGSFTHMGWCFPPLLALIRPRGSPAQLQQVDPQGRLQRGTAFVKAIEFNEKAKPYVPTYVSSTFALAHTLSSYKVSQNGKRFK
ncbi:hypothetical protein QYF61_014163 [Mycteria americana]|uniref:Uncharacterized protein n=1 Tax=Mycteria americana TaxID=33587 RepID=A0AAN7S9J3_MYCAM|nr:hypothetical protein QYF61_014163 [Mycteria americana]